MNYYEEFKDLPYREKSQLGYTDDGDCAVFLVAYHGPYEGPRIRQLSPSFGHSQRGSDGVARNFSGGTARQWMKKYDETHPEHAW